MFKKALAAAVIAVLIPIVWVVGKLDAIVLEGPNPYGEDEDEDADEQEPPTPPEPDDDE
jgi:hypothetical protein